MLAKLVSKVRKVSVIEIRDSYLNSERTMGLKFMVVSVIEIGDSYLNFSTEKDYYYIEFQ